MELHAANRNTNSLHFSKGMAKAMEAAATKAVVVITAAATLRAEERENTSTAASKNESHFNVFD